VEEGWIDTPVTRLVAREYLHTYENTNIDALVLGCTHYPLLKPVISAVLGPGVTLVDSAVETSREVARVLAARGIAAPAGEGEFHVVLSDTSPSFGDIATRFLGRRVSEIELVSVL
jgi:glutamate racemase